MSGPLEPELVADAARLAALEPDWWRLWRRSAAATPFGTPAWLLPWWRSFAPGRLAAIAVHRAGALVALAPFYLEEGPFGQRLLPLGIGVSDHLDVLLDPDHATDAGRVLSGRLAVSREWRSVEIEELAPGAAARGLPVPPGCTESAAAQSACPVLTLPGPGGDPLATVPAGQRRKVRMARHRAARRGGQVAAVEPAELAGFLGELERLHMARQEVRGEQGVFRDPRVLAFQSEALPRLSDAGLLRATRLTIEGRVAGAYVGFLAGGKAYAYLGGFDEAFAFESPGTVLLAHAIEDAVSEGCGEFHCLRGREPYKYQWGAVDRYNERRSFLRTEPPT